MNGKKAKKLRKLAIQITDGEIVHGKYVRQKKGGPLMHQEGSTARVYMDLKKTFDDGKKIV